MPGHARHTGERRGKNAKIRDKEHLQRDPTEVPSPAVPPKSSTKSDKNKNTNEEVCKYRDRDSIDNEEGRRGAGQAGKATHYLPQVPLTGGISTETIPDEGHVIMHKNSKILVRASQRPTRSTEGHIPQADSTDSPTITGAFPPNATAYEAAKHMDRGQTSGLTEGHNEKQFRAEEQVFPEIEEKQSLKAAEETHARNEEMAKQAEAKQIQKLNERLAELRSQVTSTKETYELLSAKNRELKECMSTLNECWHEKINFLESQRQVLNASRSFAAREGTLDAAALIQSFEDLNSSIGDFSFEVLRGLDESADTPLTEEAYDDVARALTPGPPDFIGQERKRSDLLDFIEWARKKYELKASDIIDPLVMGIIVEELMLYVFQPFAPRMGPQQSDVLAHMYENMRDTEPQERSARWRSITYRHSGPGYTSMETASNLCVGRVQRVLNALSRKDDSLASEYYQLSLGIFQAAEKVQGRAKKDYLSFDYDIYAMPSKPDLSKMEVSQGDIAEPSKVFITIGLGMEAKRTDQGKVERSIPVKATVICNNWDPNV